MVGTGGDASGTYNISTCAAFIVAGAGVPVAKHGNRALSSRPAPPTCSPRSASRSSCAPDEVARCIREAGIGFMFAPAHHPAMRNVGPTRVELGTRTIFNLLGPLSNPAGVKRQMVGVFSRQWVEPLAQVLKNLGSERAWVVHGSDGLDEITTAGATYVAALENGSVRSFEITPEDVGLAAPSRRRCAAATPTHNAQALRDVLEGRRAPTATSRCSMPPPAWSSPAAPRISARASRSPQKSIDSGAAEGRARPPDRGLERLRRAMADILDKIEAYKREEIAAAKRARPLAAIEAARQGRAAAARLSARARAQARAPATTR